MLIGLQNPTSIGTPSTSDDSITRSNGSGAYGPWCSTRDHGREVS